MAGTLTAVVAAVPECGSGDGGDGGGGGLITSTVLITSQLTSHKESPQRTLQGYF